jgi:NAD(P)-dependent dehydrogenase (short-subunit alcohol dehydrogenase family)
MDLGLKDKVILITGGAKGIGAAIVKACARESAVPVIVDRDTSAAWNLQAELQSSGGSCGFIAADLLNAEECARVVQECAGSFGKIDALVNNAGVNDKVGLANGTPSDFVQSLNRNLMHYYNMAHYALPHLKRSKGTIVNIGSKTAMTGQGGTSGYACAKGGILALTREWAVELLPDGIRVNAIVPAEVMTPLYRQWLDTFPKPEEKLAAILSRIPLGKRMTRPEEIAATAVFLISPESGHTTGQHLSVDGGYVHLDRAVT